MTEIIKGKLYLGNQHDANNINFLFENNIDTVITVANWCELSPLISSLVKTYKFDIIDYNDEDISKYFPTIIELIESNKCILVHCAAGVSRSATIVIAYLMNTYEMSLLDAFKLVKSKRSIINPNHSFMHQLITYEYKLYGKNSVPTVGYEYKKALFY